MIYKPEYGQTFYTIISSVFQGFTINKCVYVKWREGWDRANIEQGNCFRTEEEAQKILNTIQEILKGEENAH
jgi:hypothetical protein